MKYLFTILLLSFVQTSFSQQYVSITNLTAQAWKVHESIGSNSPTPQQQQQLIAIRNQATSLSNTSKWRSPTTNQEYTGVRIINMLASYYADADCPNAKKNYEMLLVLYNSFTKRETYSPKENKERDDFTKAYLLYKDETDLKHSGTNGEENITQKMYMNCHVKWKPYTKSEPCDTSDDNQNKATVELYEHKNESDPKVLRGFLDKWKCLVTKGLPQFKLWYAITELNAIRLDGKDCDKFEKLSEEARMNLANLSLSGAYVTWAKKHGVDSAYIDKIHVIAFLGLCKDKDTEKNKAVNSVDKNFEEATTKLGNTINNPDDCINVNKSERIGVYEEGILLTLTLNDCKPKDANLKASGFGLGNYLNSGIRSICTKIAEVILDENLDFTDTSIKITGLADGHDIQKTKYDGEEDIDIIYTNVHNGKTYPLKLKKGDLLRSNTALAALRAYSIAKLIHEQTGIPLKSISLYANATKKKGGEHRGCVLEVKMPNAFNKILNAIDPKIAKAYRFNKKNNIKP